MSKTVIQRLRLNPQTLSSADQNQADEKRYRQVERQLRDAADVLDAEAQAAQAYCVSARRYTKYARVLPTELRRAFIADGVGRARGICVDHHEPAG